MKKVLLAFVGCALVAATSIAAPTNTVVSVNAVGFVKKDLPPDGVYFISGINFDNLSGPSTLSSVFGTQLRSSGNYVNADRIIVFDPLTQSYQAYAIWNGDNQFYPCNTATEWETSSPTNPALPVGAAFWIATGGQAGDATNTVYLMGEVVDAPTQQVAIVSGYQMISYPFSSELAVKDSNFKNCGATSSGNYANADRIIVFENGQYQAYGLFTDLKWYPCNTATEWENAVDETTKVIGVGEGFWYVAQTPFVWSEPNKYLTNLRN